MNNALAVILILAGIAGGYYTGFDAGLKETESRVTTVKEEVISLRIDLADAKRRLELDKFKPYVPSTTTNTSTTFRPLQFTQTESEPADEEPTYGSRCNDGTWSPSTGRGTCSSHDGVDFYY